MKIATVAAEPVWKDLEKNLELTEAHVERVIEIYDSTDVILFPELSLAGLVMDPGNADIAQSSDGPAVDRLKQLAKRYQVALICGMIESNPDGKPFNTQVVIST